MAEHSVGNGVVSGQGALGGSISDDSRSKYRCWETFRAIQARHGGALGKNRRNRHRRGYNHPEKVDPDAPGSVHLGKIDSGKHMDLAHTFIAEAATKLASEMPAAYVEALVCALRTGLASKALAVQGIPHLHYRNMAAGFIDRWQSGGRYV